MPPIPHDSLLYLIVFGPRFGESLTLRIPPSTWIVVDGCRMGQLAPAAQLLRDHRARWSCIVLTHAHLDHTLGLDDVLSHDGNGPIGCFAPVVSDPSSWMRSSDPERHLRMGTTEHVLAAIRDRWRVDPSSRWDLKQGEAKQVGEAELLPLWPDAATAASARGVPEDAHNRLSTPLLVRWRHVTLLLGADLPTAEWAQVGMRWTDLNRHAGFKAPHHGSPGSISAVYGACPSGHRRLWILTPWQLGRGKLPRFEDGQGVDQLLGFEPEIHLTSLPADYDLPGPPPFRTTRGELRDGTRPRPINRAVGPLRLASRQPTNPDLSAGFVSASFRPDGSLEGLNYGRGSIVISP
jgi:hypothetical protein